MAAFRHFPSSRHHDALERIFSWRQVGLEKYGRVLANVWLGRLCLNDWLLESGRAAGSNRPVAPFGRVGATLRELGWKTPICFERAVPISPNAWWTLASTMPDAFAARLPRVAEGAAAPQARGALRRRAEGGGGLRGAAAHRRFAPPLLHFVSDPLT